MRQPSTGESRPLTTAERVHFSVVVLPWRRERIYQASAARKIAVDEKRHRHLYQTEGNHGF